MDTKIVFDGILVFKKRFMKTKNHIEEQDMVHAADKLNDASVDNNVIDAHMWERMRIDIADWPMQKTMFELTEFVNRRDNTYSSIPF